MALEDSKSGGVTPAGEQRQSLPDGGAGASTSAPRSREWKPGDGWPLPPVEIAATTESRCPCYRDNQLACEIHGPLAVPKLRAETDLLRIKAETLLLAYRAASNADEEGLASHEDWRKAWDAVDGAADILERVLDGTYWQMIEEEPSGR